MKRSQAVIRLGEQLVRELGAEDSNDTLGRWMAHHIASKIEEVASATGKARGEAERQCLESILQLWDHRSSLPDVRRPFSDCEPLFATLHSLDIDESRPRYYRNQRLAAAVDEGPSEGGKWLAAATRLDHAARVLIRYCLAEAASRTLDKSREWVKLAEALGEPGFDIRVVRQILDDSRNLVETNPVAIERKALEAMISSVDAFVKSAGAMGTHLKERLRALSVSENSAEEYMVQLCAPTELSSKEISRCAAIVAGGGAIRALASVRHELSKAQTIAILKRKNTIAGVGALKRPRERYAAQVAICSGYEFPPMTVELGYVAIGRNHRGKGLSSRLTRTLVESHRGALWATTDSEAMIRTLSAAGFRRVGSEWKGQRGRLSLWWRAKPRAKRDQ